MARGNINFVEIIKRLLFDGRTTDINLILKELVQNADDAEAKQLAFGFSEGLPEAQHPLLGGPGFFAVNSGEFRPEHADGVMSLAESPKVDDPSKIGKFGIGLKSVFYYGEVFFFLCRSQDDSGKEDEPLADVFNPYNGPTRNIRPDWDGFGRQDRALMRAALDALGVFDGFVVWVPLRTTDAITADGKNICIDPNTAGDRPVEFASILGGSDVLERLRRALPLLRHVESIEFFTPAGHSRIASECTGRSHYPDVEGQRGFGGNVLLPPNPPYTFETTEQQPKDPVFTQLQNHSLWARSTRANQVEQVADKTRAHASVTFARKRTGQGHFHLQWAVFLPLGDPGSSRCDGATEFTITFHGSFFVNADRRTILDWADAPDEPGSSGALQARWNAEVAKRGIFPLVLPTLARFAGSLSLDETEHLSAAMAAMPIFTENRAHFCRKVEWIKVITASGSQWQLLDAKSSYLNLPFHADLAAWLPGLTRLTSQRTVAVQHAPHLKSSSATPWTVADAETLFLGLQPERLGPEQIEHLSQIIDTVKNASTRPVVLRVLQRLLLLERETLEEGQSQRGYMSLIGKVPPEERFMLFGNLTRESRERLAALDTTVLLVPGHLVGNNEARASLSLSDAVLLLTELSGMTNQNALRARVLERTDRDDYQALLQTVRKMKLIQVFDINQKAWFITPDEARRLVGMDQLLTDSNGKDQQALLQAIRDAFVDYQPIFTSAALLKALGEARAKALDKQTALDLLGQHLPLADFGNRITLLTLLKINESVDRNDIPHYRYLLHAYADAEQEPLFATDTDSKALQKLGMQLYSKKNQTWCLLDPRIADHLNRNAQNFLGIHKFDQKRLERELLANKDERGLLSIDPGKFTAAERRELIEELTLDVLKALPFFATVTGSFTYLTEQCFLPSDTEFPLSLLESVHLIQQDAALEDRYQELGLRPLTTDTLTAHLLNNDQPARHVRWIIDQLTNIEFKWSPSTLRLLRTTAWLPVDQRQNVAPDHVVDLPPLETSLPDLLQSSGERGNLLVTPSQLKQLGTADIDALRHWNIFPNPRKAVDLLGEVLANDAQRRYAVGELVLPQHLSPLTYQAWHNLFGNVQRDALPILSILDSLANWDEQPDLAPRLFEKLQFAFPESRLIEILNGLAKTLKSHIRERDHLHRIYLSKLLETSLWPEASVDVLLPNASGNWRHAHQLCLEASGISLEHQLHVDWRDLFRKIASSESTLLSEEDVHTEEVATAHGAADLASLFTQWSDQVEGILIGAFLSTLGGHEAMKHLARQFLGKGRDLDLVRKDLVGAWREDRSVSRPIETVMDRVWFVPSVSSEQAVTLISLTGQPMVVRRREGNDLLAGNPQVELLSGARFDRKVNLRISNLDPRNLTSHQLEQALLEATRSVLTAVYGCIPENLDEAWKQLGDTAQFDLELAQDLIVEDGLAYIMYMLRLPKGHALKATFEELRDLKARQKQSERAGQPFKDITAQIARLKDEFQNSLDTADAETISGLLQGVRKRVEEAKYQPSSVPFEIFQNADDAVLQLWTMREDQAFLPREEENLFVVEHDAQTVTFMHWGRAINQYGLGKFQNSLYQLDLNNMLLLAASEKGDGDVSTTGRFGMGFKSSYLIAERPQVVSGRLAFEVIGGVYPRNLASNKADNVRQQLREHGEPVRGTAIRLEGTHPEAVSKALRDFNSWVPVTLIFAKAIRKIVLSNVNYHWQETSLAANLTFAHLSPGHALVDRALVFRLPSGTIVIPLGPSGPRALDPTVPTLWVTAPTRSSAAAGLIINAMFAVDIGRSEVTSQAIENLELCDALAREMEPALLALFQISERWAETQIILQLPNYLTFDQFWRSMWVLLAEQQTKTPDNFAGQLVRRLLWQVGGARELVLQYPTVPSGLAGKYDCLTCLKEVKFIVSGALEQSSLLESQVSAKTLPPGTLLHRDVWQTLRNLVGDAQELCPQPANLTLTDAIRQRFGNEPVLRHTDMPKPVPIPEKLEASDEEQETLRQYLNTFRFETATGTVAAARELLVATRNEESPSDEAMRAAFAPAGRRLHAESSAEVVALFRACRKDLNANASTLADWAQAATTDEQRLAVLRYLLKGELNNELSEKLAMHNGIWYRGLLKLPIFSQFDDRERMELAAKLYLHLDFRSLLLSGTNQGEANDLSMARATDPKAELEELYKRWTEQREELIRRFEVKRYPNFMYENGSLKIMTSDRKQWMGLFMIGSFMTLGYIEQGTGNYLTLAHDNGWMATFSSEELDADGWFRILDTYADEEETQYRQWINRFLATYQISRYLGDYIRIFQDAHHLCAPTPLWHLLDVKRSPLYTGSGLDIPSLRHALGIGQHFVLRELVRCGFISHQNLDADCYVPTKKVRKALYYYGCDIDPEEWGHETSTKIHRFLVDHLGEEKARFHGDFDLPFVLLS
ncbi:sacsin N-terminal ATP-binding-like domain-containing protein [Deinococcus sp. SM5_A1]|uniref:sacsin N-terminal ATP-binding-like domain-containing protein n=1 Tax=Deinococcus sp. SM5_A1 TaxID=3379094 RepID=UPI00385954B3